MAIELFTKAIKNHKYRTRHIAYTNIGMTNHQKVLELFPKHSPAYDNMDIAYKNFREYDLAIRAYKKSIEYSSDIVITYLRLDRIYLKLNRHEEAA